MLSQSLNGSLTSPQSNHSNSEMENCNSLLNGQSALTETTVNRLKKEIAEQQQQLEQPQLNQQQSDQPMEEDEMYGEEEENYEEEDQLNPETLVKNHLAGELERQLLNANSNATALNNLNSLLANGNNSNLLNNLAAQWNPALAALSSNGNFNNLANLTQALSSAGAFNGTTAAAISQPTNTNQNSPQNSSSGTQHNLNASSLSNNGNLSYQNGSNGSNSQITHVEAAKGYTFEEQFKQVGRLLFQFLQFLWSFIDEPFDLSSLDVCPIKMFLKRMPRFRSCLAFIVFPEKLLLKALLGDW